MNIAMEVTHAPSCFAPFLLVAGLLLFLPARSLTPHPPNTASRWWSASRPIAPCRRCPMPSNDAKRMAELLANAGFEVTAAPDLSQNEMRQTISDFAAKVAASGPDTIALVFYAGHGCRSTARTIWCRSMSIRNATPIFRCRRSGSTIS
jgi:hypothetical protein